MKRSAFLWIAGVGAVMLGMIERARPSEAAAADLRVSFGRPAERRSNYSVAGNGRPGRCHASRRTSHWVGYTIDELVA